MKIEKVKELESAYLINESISIPKNSLNRHYKKVQEWILEGGTIERDDPLIKAKSAKINKMKQNRDIYFELPLASIKGIECETNKEVHFEFKSKSTGNSLTDPIAIIFRAMIHPNVKYSCNIIEKKGKRKGYVEITKEIAESLSSQLKLKAADNIRHANELELQINACKSLEDLDKININFE